MKNFSVLLIILLTAPVAFAQPPEAPPVVQRDTVPKFVRTWVMTEDYTVMEDYPLDTAMNGFQISNPVYRRSISQSFLGNPGLQTRDNLYFNKKGNTEYLFLRPFSDYLYTPENNVFYNITRPFTILEYFASTGDRLKREEMFRAAHTQNVTPFFNMGFDIRLLGAEGTYLRQKSKFNSVSLFGSYTGNDYSIYSSFHMNTQTAQENGGLKNDSIFRNSEKDERAYQVNLEEADSKMRNISWHFTHRYKFGKMDEVPDTTSETGFRRLRARTTKTGSIIHNIDFKRNFRLYSDRIIEGNRDFYPAYYISPTATLDSTYHRSLSNTIQLMLDENPNRERDFGARAFIRHDWVKYAFNTVNDTSIQPITLNYARRDYSLRGGQLIMDKYDTLRNSLDTSIVNNRDYTYHNVHIGASVMHTVGEGWDWLARGRYYLFGYKAFDLVLDGYITKKIKGRRGNSIISIAGKFSVEEPEHFLSSYESNNFRWYNEFRKTKDIRGSLVLSNEAIKTRFKFDLSLVSDLVYFNSLALPDQHGPVETVLAGELGKDFKLGILHSTHQVNYQLSSNNNVIRIPSLSYFQSTFIGFTVVKNALDAQIGFDFYYYTKYRALAFAPSSGVFYNQDVLELGNYPYLNLFLNAKIKRTRFFIRWDHPYAGLIEKNYFHVLGYPVRGRVIQFGLSWTFYD